MKISQGIYAFLMGYFIYSMIEILYRGRTHWTMAVTGGAVMVILYFLNRRSSITLLRSCFIGAAIITAIELTVGITVNIILGWNVWDYSAIPFNFMGQICLPFSAAWFTLCIPAYYFCGAISNRFNATAHRDCRAE
jgi:uncharacterized membrane protein